MKKERKKKKENMAHSSRSKLVAFYYCTNIVAIKICFACFYRSRFLSEMNLYLVGCAILLYTCSTDSSLNNPETIASLSGSDDVINGKQMKAFMYFTIEKINKIK